MWLVGSLARALAQIGDVSLTNLSKRFGTVDEAGAGDLQQQKRNSCILRRIA